MKKNTLFTFLLISLIVYFTTSLNAQLTSEAIFKEYNFTDQFSPWIATREYYTEFSKDLTILDLDKAIRAEIAIEFWGGHIGSSDQAFKINDGEKRNFFQPETPGSPYCYFRNPLGRDAVEIPLSELKTGINTFNFYNGEQICYGFDWPFYWIYAFKVIVYYDSSKVHPIGSIVNVQNGDIIGENPQFEVVAESDTSIKSVDLIGYYEDFDWEGNGKHLDWHYRFEKGEWSNLIGKDETSPYLINWDTKWLPDQDGAVKLIAKITDERGISYLTPIIDQLQFKRNGRSVKLYKSSNIPEKFSVRVTGEKKYCDIYVDEEITYANSAKLVVSTWSGKTDNDIYHACGINSYQLADNFGAFHYFSYDKLDLPLEYINKGLNSFYIASNYEGHALEVNWPGPAILIEFDSTQTNIQKSESELGFDNYQLEQNYPNPFNPRTIINYSIPKQGNVVLKIFDLLGREIITLINKEQLKGYYEIEFDSKDYGSGIYYYSLQAGEFVETKKMVILK